MSIDTEGADNVNMQIVRTPGLGKKTTPVTYSVQVRKTYQVNFLLKSLSKAFLIP